MNTLLYSLNIHEEFLKMWIRFPLTLFFYLRRYSVPSIGSPYLFQFSTTQSISLLASPSAFFLLTFILSPHCGFFLLPFFWYSDTTLIVCSINSTTGSPLTFSTWLYYSWVFSWSPGQKSISVDSNRPLTRFKYPYRMADTAKNLTNNSWEKNAR